jgi:hypothetical protein
LSNKDISENIPLNVGNPSTLGFWNNSGEQYNIAVGGLPFMLAPVDVNPYQRGTAPYKKDQFDSSKEPGEQSLTGWWIRSQSSFHGGAGIKFYDPSSGETIPYRFVDSQGVDIWTKGQVTLLPDSTQGHNTTGEIVGTNNRSQQKLESIQWTTGGTTYQGVLMLDDYDVDKIDSNGNVTHFIDYNLGVSDKVYAVCNDGTYAYWVTNDTGPSGKMQVWKKALNLDSTSAGTMMFSSPTITVTNAVMEFVKDRIVMCANNAVYEVSPNAATIPTPVYTNPNTNYIYTSIAASGSAIYTSGVSGIYSTIQKYTLNTSGSMPTLTSAVVTCEFPAGEIVHRIFYYLGYVLIGTDKGIRASLVSDQDGGLSYGPLIVKTTQPCYDFAAYDRFVWAATGVGSTDAGLTRLDLSTTVEGEPLRFAYTNDLQYVLTENHKTTAVKFIGNTTRLAYTTAANTVGTVITNKVLTSNVATLTTSTAHGLVVGDKVWVTGVGTPFDSTTGAFTVTAVTTNTFSFACTYTNIASTAVSSSAAIAVKPGYSYQQHATDLMSTGYLQTGAIRFGTLEPKNYKFVRARGDYSKGAMDIFSIEENGDLYDIITYNSATGNPEVATTQPEGSQEYVSFKFALSRDATTTSTGPIFKGYQIKALPATKRQRIIKFPVYCFDVETDKYGVQSGYEGRSWDRITTLETLEANGDIVNVQDFRTDERVQGIIENITFSNSTPPSGRYSGFGGLLTITVRTVL